MEGARRLDIGPEGPALAELGDQLASGFLDVMSVVSQAKSVITRVRDRSQAVEPSDPAEVDSFMERLAESGGGPPPEEFALVADSVVMIAGGGIRLHATGEGVTLGSLSVRSGETSVSAFTCGDDGQPVELPGVDLGGPEPTHIVAVRRGVTLEDMTVAGGNVLVDYKDPANIFDPDAAVERAFDAGLVAFEETEADAERGAAEFAAMVGSQSPRTIGGIDVEPIPTDEPTTERAPTEGAAIAEPAAGAESLVAGVTGIAREAVRRRGTDAEQRAEEEMPKEPTQAEVATAGRTPESDVSGGPPDHFVGPDGTTIGSVESGSPPSADLAGQAVRRLEDSGSGWTLVECLNGARCWVDPAGLRPLAEQETATSPEKQAAATPPEVEFWFHVYDTVPVQKSDGSIVGQLSPGTWYPAHEEAGAWTSTTDSSGQSGWVATAVVNRA